MYDAQAGLRSRPATLPASSTSTAARTITYHTAGNEAPVRRGNTHDGVQMLWQLCEREVQRMAEMCEEHGNVLHHLQAQLEQVQSHTSTSSSSSSSGLVPRNSAEASRLVQGVTQLRILQLRLNSAHAIMSSTLARVAQQVAVFAESTALYSNNNTAQEAKDDNDNALMQTQLRPQLAKLDTVMRDFLATLNEAADLSLAQLMQGMRDLCDADSELRRGVAVLAEAVHARAAGTLPAPHITSNGTTSNSYRTAAAPVPGRGNSFAAHGDGEDRQRTLYDAEALGHEANTMQDVLPPPPPPTAVVVAAAAAANTRDSSRLSTMTITGQPRAESERAANTPLYARGRSGPEATLEAAQMSHSVQSDRSMHSTHSVGMAYTPREVPYDTQAQASNALLLHSSLGLSSQSLSRPSPALNTTTAGQQQQQQQQQAPSQLLMVSAVQQAFADVVLPRLQAWLAEHLQHSQQQSQQQRTNASVTQCIEVMQGELRQLVEAQHELLRGVLTSLNNNNNNNQRSIQPQAQQTSAAGSSRVQDRAEKHMDVRARHWQRVAQELQQDLLSVRTALRNEGRRYAQLEEANVRLRQKVLSLQAALRGREGSARNKVTRHTPRRGAPGQRVTQSHRQANKEEGEEDEEGEDEDDDTVARSLSSSLSEEDNEYNNDNKDDKESFYTVTPQSRMRPAVRMFSNGRQQRPPQTSTMSRNEPPPVRRGRSHSVGSAHNSVDISISPLSEEEEEEAEEDTQQARRPQASRNGGGRAGQTSRTSQPRSAHGRAAAARTTGKSNNNKKAEDEYKRISEEDNVHGNEDDVATEREVRRAVDDARSLLQRLKASAPAAAPPSYTTRRMAPPRHAYTAVEHKENNEGNDGEEEEEEYAERLYNTRRTRPAQETYNTHLVHQVPPLVPPSMRRRERSSNNDNNSAAGAAAKETRQDTLRAQLAALAGRRRELLQELDALHTQQDNNYTGTARRRQGGNTGVVRDSVSHAQERQRLLTAVHKIDAAMATLQSRVENA